jgi:putative phosphoesterase
MKIGIISDIHGNYQALQAVLSSLDDHGVDLILCAGDLVCYGAQPNEVIESVIERGIPCVSGNYDAAVAWNLPRAARKPSTPLNEPLKQAVLTWTKAEISEEHKHYLKGLPSTSHFRLDNRHLCMIHAGLDHLDEWHSPDEPIGLVELARRTYADVILLGHTHDAFSCEITSQCGGKPVRFINPCAVGRSLDGDPRASFAIFDTTSGQVRLVRINYDIGEAIRRIRASTMPEEIALLVQYAARRMEQLPAYCEEI